MIYKTLAQDSIFLIRYILFVNVSSAQNDLQNTGPGFRIYT